MLYGIGLLPLSALLLEEFPGLVQPWYADDAAAQGDSQLLAQWLRRLREEGPKRGYRPEPSKSILLVHPGSDHEATREPLAEFPLQLKQGARYLGGFLGGAEALDAWLQPQLDGWVAGVERLAAVAPRYPHTAFSGLSHSLQGEW